MDQPKSGITIRHPLIKSLTIRPYSVPTQTREQMAMPRPTNGNAIHQVGPNLMVRQWRPMPVPVLRADPDDQLPTNNNPDVQAQCQEFIQLLPAVAEHAQAKPFFGPHSKDRFSTPVYVKPSPPMLPSHLTIRPVNSNFRVIKSHELPAFIDNSPSQVEVSCSLAATTTTTTSSSQYADQPTFQMVQSGEDTVLQEVVSVPPADAPESNDEPHVTLTKGTNQQVNYLDQVHTMTSEVLDFTELHESNDTKLSDMVDEISEMGSAEGSFNTNEENLFEYEDCSSLIENAAKGQQAPVAADPNETALLNEWHIDEPGQVAPNVNKETIFGRARVPKGKPRTLGWHIQQALERHHSGMTTLNIENGLLSDSQSRESLIIRMNGEPTVQSLEHELRFIAYQSSKPFWKPAVRKDRVRSLLGHELAPVEVPKRRRSSTFINLELDEAGQYKRRRVQNLLCDEELLLESSDDQSLPPDTKSSEASEERVLIPSPPPGMSYVGDLFGRNSGDEEILTIQAVSQCPGEPTEQGEVKKRRRYKQRSKPAVGGEFPLVKAQGRQMFNSIGDIWKLNRAKVRECFRPRTSEFRGTARSGFDLLNWQSNVGVLWGSNLNFSVNELGLIDIITNCEDDDVGMEEDQPDLADHSRNDDEEQPRLKNSGLRLEQKCAMPINSFWEDYLEQTKAFAAPSYLFKHIRMMRHPLAKGMQVELVNPENTHGDIVRAIVADTLGGRVALQLPSQQIFYYNDNSWEILPVGFAKRMNYEAESLAGHHKRPPAQYINDDLVLQSELYVSSLKVGMLVEAFDWKGEYASGQLRMATIMRLLKDRVLVKFYNHKGPGTLPENNYWCARDSPLIRPVGYHKEVKMRIDTIKYPKDACWATKRELPMRSPRPFAVGMKLEAVDRVNPDLIRPATVLGVQGFEILIGYDGFPEEYAFWALDDSEDIYPIDWCAQNGHRLEPIEKEAECAIRFCNDAGNRNGISRYHSSKANCPYDYKRYFGEGPKNPNVALRCSKSPKIAVQKEKPPPKAKEDVNTVRSGGLSADETISLLEEKVAAQKKIIKSWNIVKDYGPKYKQNLALWEKHSRSLPTQSTSGSSNPMNWSCAQVKYFISQVPNCRYLGGLFEASDIDGEALLSLCESDLTDVMSLKLGLAIKIYNAIVVLRNRYLKEVAGEGEQFQARK